MKVTSSFLPCAGTDLPASDSRAPGAAAGNCTSEALNTHKTEPRRILYLWHPLYGKELTICGDRNRHGTLMYICRVADDSLRAPLEVPAWMFDAAKCCHLAPASFPRVDVESLIALCALLETPSARTKVVIEAHHSTFSGGCDAQDQQANNYSVGIVYNEAAEADSPDERQSQTAPAADQTSARSRRSSGRPKAQGGLRA
jgi:hypothetical protein